jgi:hypothetical protein
MPQKGLSGDTPVPVSYKTLYRGEIVKDLGTLNTRKLGPRTIMMLAIHDASLGPYVQF